VRYIKLQVIIAISIGLKTRRYAIGVDGGATKTVALIGTEKGEILGRGESGSSNYHNVGTDAASKAIKIAVSRARKRARIRESYSDIGVIALAAVNSPRDLATARDFVRAAEIAPRVFVVHDSVAALHAATHGKPGIVVISGTGCMAAGINKAGRYVRAGGWGYIIDDEGSAYDIGTKALRSAFRTLDGRTPRTKLASALRRRFRVKMLENASPLIYSAEFGIDSIAGLTPLVSKLAPSDEVCREILRNSGVALAGLTCVVAKQLGIEHDAFSIALVGGTFKAGRYLLQPFRARVRKECPRAEVLIMKTEPVLGALALAVSELQEPQITTRKHGPLISRRCEG
jgi:N-acetylglucosamine kinase-like BadF-type ATPase